MGQKVISKAVIKRLPRYYRYLGELLDAGVERISSGELSQQMKVTASQIRQDLNNFGGFGQQGYGYNVYYLRTEIAKILGLDRPHKMIIIGAGNLAQALANYAKFEKNSFHVVGLFDNNKALKRKMVRDIPIMMIDELPGFLQKNDVEIAALTLPKENAIDMAQILVENGIHAIWNFAHTDLNLVVPKTVAVQNVHLSESLMRLSYNLKTLEEEGEIK
jgi:redox-sensing transcriptional repressor